MMDGNRIIEGDLLLKEDASFEENVRCTGTITIKEGVTLTASRYALISAKDLVLKGKILIAGEEEGFKPGHVFGKEAKNPLVLRIEDQLTIDGGSIVAKEAVIAAGRGSFRGEVSLTGMFGFEELTIHPGARLVTRGGSWLITERMDIGDDAVFDLSETEICVIKSRKGDDLEGAKGGFYDHEGYGDTRIGRRVSVLGDDTFIWLWFGRTEGAFQTIRGNIVLKCCEGIFTDADDMKNIETSEITGSGTEEDPFRYTYREIDPEYEYHNSRKLAVDAVVNNALQDRLPGCLIFDFNKELFAFTEKHFRAGNILIHELYFDPPTIRAFADFSAIVTEA